MDFIPAIAGAAPTELPGTFGPARSCCFCRANGIRCSAQSVCDACRAHGVECVYEACGGGGRRPSKPPLQPPVPETFSGYASPDPSLASTAATPPEASGVGRQLFEELDHVAHRLFDQNHLSLAAEIHQSGYWHGNAVREPAHGGPSLPFRDVLNGLAQSIVELFLIRFNSLGCSPCEQTALTGIGRLLFQNQPLPSFSVFAPPVPPQNLTDHKVHQRIEVWFATHPLSFAVSKTLLFQSYRNGTHDRDLLAIILAEASFILNDQEMSCANAVIEAASARVLERSSLSLSTTQALIVLGWHDFCLQRPRQGCCYLELARRASAQYLSDVHRGSPGDYYLNGVNIRAVEFELYQRIHWITSSLALWVNLHRTSPDFDALSPLDTASLPPPDLSSSTVYSLDETSGNIASLVAQTTGVRELWSLAHLTSTIAPIFKLRLQLQSRQQQRSRMGSLSEANSAMQHLQNHQHHVQHFAQPTCMGAATPQSSMIPSAPAAPARPAMLVMALRALLADARARLPAQLDHSNPSQTFTCSVYQLIAIHTAFSWSSTSYSSATSASPSSASSSPSPLSGGGGGSADARQAQQQQQQGSSGSAGGAGDGIIAGDPVAVLHAIRTFLAATQTMQRQAALQDLFGGRDHDVRTGPLVVLGLDTCGRAVMRIKRRQQQQQQQQQQLSPQSQKLQKIVQEAAERLWDASGSQTLRNEPGLRVVRERLARLVGKDVVQRQQSAPSTAAVPSSSMSSVSSVSSSSSSSSVLPQRTGSGGGEALWTGGVEGLEVTWSGEPDLSSSAAEWLLDEDADMAAKASAEGLYGGWHPVMY